MFKEISQEHVGKLGSSLKFIYGENSRTLNWSKYKNVAQKLIELDFHPIVKIK